MLPPLQTYLDLVRFYLLGGWGGIEETQPQKTSGWETGVNVVQPQVYSITNEIFMAVGVTYMEKEL